MISAVIGLGNPGPRYRSTRHNIGARIVEEFVLQQPDGSPLSCWKTKFHGRWTQISLPPRSLRVLIPETYMNKSGESVRPFCDFFSLSPANIIVIHDDLELPFGRVVYREGGGLGGHNGLRSIEKHLGSRNFARLRIGIGRPSRGDTASWVLARFSPQEEGEIADVIANGVTCVVES